MARTKIRESQVIDSDFASEDELSEYVAEQFENHNKTAIHIPVPDSVEDDQKILRYDGESNTVEWIDQADIQTIALPYYYDEAREKYLDNQIMRVMFSKPGTNKRRTYMDYAPGIASSKFPYELRTGENMCLVFFEYSTTDENSGKVIEIRDENNNAKALATLNLGNTDTDYAYSDTLDINFNEGTAVSAYILKERLDNAVLVLGFRKIYYPE